MTTQTTTTATEEAVALPGPSMVPAEIPPWDPSGPRLERRRSFEVQSP
jgi:hypothetical protein